MDHPARPQTARRFLTTTIAGTSLAAAFALLGPLAGRAEAHNWFGATGATGCSVNITDTADQTYHYSTTVNSVKLRAAFDWNRTNNVDPLTKLWTTHLSAWNGFTDIVAIQGDWTGNSPCQVLGSDGQWHTGSWCCETTGIDTLGNPLPFIGAAALCQSPNAANECESHHLPFDTDNLAANGWGDNYIRGLVCHEIGHTLGLTHGPACMVDPADTTRQYFSDQRTHINAYSGH